MSTRASNRLLSYLPFAALGILLCCSSSAVRAADKVDLLTEENYNKIHVGMTSDEVKEILGKPTSGSGTKGSWTSTWHGADKKDKIDIHTKDSVVDKKSTTFTWAKADAAKPDTTTPDAAKPEPETKKPKTPNDKLDAILKDMHSADEKTREKAFKSLCKANFDEERAPVVTKYLIAHLHDKGLREQMDVKSAMRTWLIPENAEHFLKVVEHKPKSDNVGDPEREAFDFAVEMLVKLKDPRAVEPIAKGLQYGFFCRSTAEGALKKFGPELAQAEVLKYVGDKNSDVAQAAKGILDSFKTSGGDLLTQHLNDMKADKPEKRYLAISAINNMEVDPKRREEVALALAAELKDNPGKLSDDLKKGERDAKIGKAGNGLTGLIGEMEKHPANAAMVTLIKWGGPECEAAVAEQLTSSIEDIRVGAARAMATCGTKKSIPTLQKAGLAEKDKSMGSYCEAAIKAIQARGK